MTYELKLRLFLAIAMAVATFFSVKSINRTDRCLPFDKSTLLPTYFGVLAVMSLLTEGRFFPMERIFPALFQIFLSISLYYILLFVTLPLFREKLTPQSCTLLWLLPDFLYLFMVPNFDSLAKPVVTISISRSLLLACGQIWFVGFLAVMIWKIVSHLLFRYGIVKHSQEITDETIISMWKDAQTELQLDPRVFTVPRYSPAVTSPLTIGLIRSFMLVVLPEKEYTEAELSLIFRHEAVHIQRKDASSKLFLTFCTALCWFNPFMWHSMKSCSADLELSCDQTVLSQADDNTRQQYAKLILNTAGDERGFTTCLSASAEALRYRLKRILAPGSTHQGRFLLPLLTFLLIMSTGLVALSIS